MHETEDLSSRTEREILHFGCLRMKDFSPSARNDNCDTVFMRAGKGHTSVKMSPHLYPLPEGEDVNQYSAEK